jgi:hypothetical protein
MSVDVNDLDFFYAGILAKLIIKTSLKHTPIAPPFLMSCKLLS